MICRILLYRKRYYSMNTQTDKGLFVKLFTAYCSSFKKNMAFDQPYNYVSCLFKKKKKAVISLFLGVIFMAAILTTNFNILVFFDREMTDDYFIDGNTTSNGWNVSVSIFHSSKFQKVTSAGDSIVFSAFLDTLKFERKIRAIGMKEGSISHDMYCLLWYKTFRDKIDSVYTIAAGYIDPHPENFDRRYGIMSTTRILYNRELYKFYFSTKPYAKKASLILLRTATHRTTDCFGDRLIYAYFVNERCLETTHISTPLMLNIF